MLLIRRVMNDNSDKRNCADGMTAKKRNGTHGMLIATGTCMKVNTC